MTRLCVLSVATSRTYKALVIGKGRVIIRGNNTITDYATATTNRFTGVVYALNLQTATSRPRPRRARSCASTPAPGSAALSMRTARTRPSA